MSEPWIGPYRILSEARQEVGAVFYQGRDMRNGREVTLELLSPSHVDRPEDVARLAHEARILGALDHPNIVSIYELGSSNDMHYIALERLDGFTLRQALEGGGTLQPSGEGRLDIGLALFVQILRGLDHVHRAGFVHRDIRPANVFLQADGEAKITGFGLATSDAMPGTGKVLGSADYMSPEQVKGSPVDGRTDIFNVGCMLYELLEGQRPFRAETLPATLYKIQHEEPDFDRVAAGPAHDALLPIVGRALAKRVEDRYQQASSMADDIERVRQLPPAGTDTSESR